jgi:transposase-like protein
MSLQGQKYTASEKAKIALEAVKGELTQSQITSKYGVHSTQIGLWKKQLIESLPVIFSDKMREKDKSQEKLIEELYKQIGQLKVELDWIKKKSELFR